MNNLKQQTMEWISVEDRLPEDETFCLVIAPQSFPKNCIMLVAEFVYGTFYSESSECAMDDVTHWMPLPKPPSND